ncbi:MAG: hypothetical protein ACNS62_07490 [Candidatus Cyclobacteriaceae bacterium M3_2C_046]
MLLGDIIIGKRIVVVVLKIKFANNSVPFFKLELECGFEIKSESFTSFVEHDKNDIKIPCSLLKHLAVIAIGTARGVIHAKTEGTNFNKIFLPTINVNEQIKEDVIFNF